MLTNAESSMSGALLSLHLYAYIANKNSSPQVWTDLWSQNLGAVSYGQADARGYTQKGFIEIFFRMNDDYD